MVSTTASVSEVFTDHELLRLGSFTRVLFLILLRDLSFTAIMKSLVPYSKTFDSNYNVSSQEACRTEVAKPLV